MNIINVMLHTLKIFKTVYVNSCKTCKFYNSFHIFQSKCRNTPRRNRTLYYLLSMAKDIITPNSAVKPGDANAYCDKGKSLADLGRYDEAITCYDKAIELKPDFDLAHRDKGLALANLGRYDDAIKCCDKAIELKPDFDFAHSSKGLALYKLGRHDEAIKCFDKAIELKPDDDSAHSLKRLALEKLGR